MNELLHLLSTETNWSSIATTVYCNHPAVYTICCLQKEIILLYTNYGMSNITRILVYEMNDSTTRLLIMHCLISNNDYTASVLLFYVSNAVGLIVFIFLYFVQWRRNRGGRRGGCPLKLTRGGGRSLRFNFKKTSHCPCQYFQSAFSVSLTIAIKLYY